MKAEGRRQKAEGSGGPASQNISMPATERQSLSALCGGRAAGSLGLAQLLSAFRLLPAAFCLLLTAHCSLLTVFAQFTQSQSNSPLYSARPCAPRAPSGLPKALNGIGIDQKLNEQLPLDLPLVDENGKNVKLGDYFGKKPVVLSLVYYQCPMLCNQILSGMLGSLRQVTFNAGEQFEIVTVSFDPNETPALAAKKKETYIKAYNRPSGAAGWHFLTGDAANIKRLTEAVGFHYLWDEQTKQFAHASGIMLATPEGKLARYFYGIEYPPRDLRLGLVEASENKIGTPVDTLMLYCYHYDPSTGKYGAVVMNVIRAGGVVTLLLMGGMLLVLRKVSRRRVQMSEPRQVGVATGP